MSDNRSHYVRHAGPRYPVNAFILTNARLHSIELSSGAQTSRRLPPWRQPPVDTLPVSHWRIFRFCYRFVRVVVFVTNYKDYFLTYRTQIGWYSPIYHMFGRYWSQYLLSCICGFEFLTRHMIASSPPRHLISLSSLLSLILTWSASNVGYAPFCSNGGTFNFRTWFRYHGDSLPLSPRLRTSNLCAHLPGMLPWAWFRLVCFMAGGIPRSSSLNSLDVVVFRLTLQARVMCS